MDTVDEAVRTLSSDPEWKVLAGGHSLLPLMRLRLAQPPGLVDVSRIEELKYVREDGDRLAIGALTRHHDVATSDTLRELCPIVAHAAGQIGDPQVRHVGTIGGSVALGYDARVGGAPLLVHQTASTAGGDLAYDFTMLGARKGIAIRGSLTGDGEAVTASLAFPDAVPLTGRASSKTAGAFLFQRRHG